MQRNYPMFAYSILSEYFPYAPIQFLILICEGFLNVSCDAFFLLIFMAHEYLFFQIYCLSTIINKTFNIPESLKIYKVL